MSVHDSLIALLVMAIWGFNFVVAKWGMAEFPPMFIMCLRFIVVAAVLVPFAPFPRGRLMQIFLLSLVLGIIHFPLMFNGLLGLDAATTSIVGQAQVPFASLRCGESEDTEFATISFANGKADFKMNAQNFPITLPGLAPSKLQ